MTNKLKKARANLIKSAKELDSISKCYHGKKKAITTIVKSVLKQYYKY